jgi:hypothetical protein
MMISEVKKKYDGKFDHLFQMLPDGPLVTGNHPSSFSTLLQPHCEFHGECGSGTILLLVS